MLLRHPKHFINRELSWLEFNERVLEEALDDGTPLLDRLKFLGIASSNLDEFFMIRVSGVQEQISADVRTRGPAGDTPAEQLALIHRQAHAQVGRLYGCLRDGVLPALAAEGISLAHPTRLPRGTRQHLRGFFQREVFPVLTPLAVDSAHPFPHLRNLSLNLAIRLEAPADSPRGGQQLFAIVQVPKVLARVVPLESRSSRLKFCLLEDVIADNADALFPGLKMRECVAFRVTRDADLEFAEDEAEDLLKSIEAELRERERGRAVRLEISSKVSAPILKLITTAIDLPDTAVYRLDGPLNITDLSRLSQLDGMQDLKESPFVPAVRQPLRDGESIFDVIGRQEVLLHHPYESFSPVVEFIRQAAEDPNVLAIKQTLYRTSGDSPIVRALMRAAENGKQVAALVELKARFDEENNIVWAKRMEEAGVHVVYGLVGLKTHCKLALVVRREGQRLRRYAHLGTGNYNPTTARIYTDLGFFTTDEQICDDAAELFNLLTGYAHEPAWRKIVVAPTGFREALAGLIREETEKAADGKPARIRAKMNALVDDDLIVALYKASAEGVKIELAVRGVCCLRPGVPGVSENIRVWSIVDRFLEHSRLFIFGEDEEAKVFISSADWMPRNLDRRIEVMVPISDKRLVHRLIQIFEFCAQDNIKARDLTRDGTWVRRRPERGTRRFQSQEEFLKLERQMRLRSEEQHAEDHPADSSQPREVAAGAT